MILSDGDIRKRLEQGDLRITPAPDLATQLQPASLDLRLGRLFQFPGPAQDGVVLDPADPESFRPLSKSLLDEHESIDLERYAFALATTEESISLPRDLVARIEGRSSLGRIGLIIHSTAGFVDPGWRGALTLELSNLGFAPIRLHPGMRICQLSFELLLNPAETPYGVKSAKYQGQWTTRSSRLFDDVEFQRA